MMNWRLIAPLNAMLLVAACGQQVDPAADHRSAATPSTAVAADLDIAVGDGTPSGAALWLHPTDVARSLILTADADAGLVLRDLGGAQRGSFGSGGSEFVAVTYGFDAGQGPGALVVAQDRAAAALRAWVIDPATLQPREITAAPLPLADELTGLCLYRSNLSGRSYAFAATDNGGELQQWELSGRGGAVHGRIVRRIPLGKGVGHCAVDEAERVVYVADEAVGLWRVDAEPEADLGGRELVELTAPRGTLGEEVKGLAIHEAAGAKYLLAADEAIAGVRVYSLPAVTPAGVFAPAGVTHAEIETLWTGGFGAGPREAGIVLLADEGGSGGAVYHQLKWADVAAALKLPAAAPVDPRALVPATARTVEPVVETAPVDDYGDAADDPAIWVHPTDPAASLIIGAQKQRGVEVYDLSGRRVQLLADGRTNNVDLRQGVLLGGRKRDIVAGSNREQGTLALYEVNAATRRLANAVAAPIPAGMRDPYGLCMYHSAKTGKLYVFMNNSDAGEFRQWEVEAAGDGRLTAKVVREFTVGTQAEGCVADDDSGALYIAEEEVGVWRYGAEPDAGSGRRQLDSTGEGGRLKADVEGLGIFRGRDGAGYLVVSNQGADNYAVYRRDGDNAFLGHFSIVANDELGIDGASETDGLEVTSAPLGKAFPHGLLVVQDGRNITPAERQNFKLVPWEQVVAALGL